ncbi:MAG: phage major capsid protein [Eubacteriales bacterium]
MRLKEIEARLSAIKTELAADGADLDKLNKETDDLIAERNKIVADAEKRNSLLGKIAGGAGEQRTDFSKLFTPGAPGTPGEQRSFDPTTMTRDEVIASPEYRNAFFKRMRGQQLTETEQRAYSSASDSAGAAIPTETQNMLFNKMVKIAPMLSEITLLRVAGNVSFAVEGTRDAAYQHAENAAITVAADSIVQVTLAGYEFNKVISISKTVQTMSINAFEGWLTDMLYEDIGRKIEDAIINGTGSSAPQGVKYAHSTWGTYEISTTSAIGYDDVMDLIAKLPAGYDPNAKFLTNKQFVYTGLAKIKDDQKNPILVKDMENGLRFILMGYPVVISDKVGTGELYFGDYKKVVGNLAQDITVDMSEHSSFKNNAIDYRGGAIFDSKVALSEAIVRFKKN